MKKIACLILLLSVTGCAGKKISANMASWMGAHQSKLILSWGPPTETHDDGKGGKVLVWLYDRGTTTTSTTTSVDPKICPQCSDVTVSRERENADASRMFWVNEEGLIYHWRWRGY